MKELVPDKVEKSQGGLPVKEPTTYEEQLELIKKKGFIVDDEKECIERLKEVNYYRLSAYFIPG